MLFTWTTFVVKIGGAFSPPAKLGPLRGMTTPLVHVRLFAGGFDYDQKILDVEQDIDKVERTLSMIEAAKGDGVAKEESQLRINKLQLHTRRQVLLEMQVSELKRMYVMLCDPSC